MCEGENKRIGTASTCCLHTVLYIWLVYVSMQALCVSRYGISVKFACHIQSELNFGWELWAVWVNRFANAGEAAVEAAGNTIDKVSLFSSSPTFCLNCFVLQY
jgi:hypothetical protein